MGSHCWKVTVQKNILPSNDLKKATTLVFGSTHRHIAYISGWYTVQNSIQISKWCEVVKITCYSIDNVVSNQMLGPVYSPQWFWRSLIALIHEVLSFDRIVDTPRQSSFTICSTSFPASMSSKRDLLLITGKSLIVYPSSLYFCLACWKICLLLWDGIVHGQQHPIYCFSTLFLEVKL